MQAWNWRIIADSAESYKKRRQALEAAVKLAQNLEGKIEVFDKMNNRVIFPN